MNEWPFLSFPSAENLEQGESLKGVFLPKLIAEISNECLTGMLWLKSGNIVTGIHWRSGEIVFAVSNTERFGMFLVEQRHISQEHLLTVENFCRANATDICDGLLRLGYLESSSLIPLLKTYLYITVYSCLDLADGFYSFETVLPRIPYELLTSIHVAELVLEATQNLFPVARLKSFLGAYEQARLVPAEGIKLGDSYKYKSQAALIERLTASINTYQTLRREVKSEDDLIRIIAALVALGAIRMEELRSEASGATEAEGEEYAQVTAADIPMFLYEIENMLGHLRSSKDHYSRLEVARQAPTSEIEAVYRRLCKRFSPDRCLQLVSSMPLVAEQLAEIRRYLDQAFSVLSDNLRRREYNDELKRSEGVLIKDPINPVEVTTGSHKRPVDSQVDAQKSSQQSKASKEASLQKNPYEQRLSIDLSRMRNADDWYLLGLELLERGEGARAVRVFQNAIKMRPNDGEFHAALARACDVAYGYNEQTVRMFERAIDLNRSCEADYQAELGVFYLKHGKLEQAEARLNKALAIDPLHRVATKAYAKLNDKKKL